MAFPALLAMLGRVGGTAGAEGGIASMLGGMGGKAGQFGSILENIGAASQAVPPPLPYQGTAFEGKAFEGKEFEARQFREKEFEAKPFSLNPADADRENARLDAHNKREARRKQEHEAQEAARRAKHDAGQAKKKQKHDAGQAGQLKEHEGKEGERKKTHDAKQAAAAQELLGQKSQGTIKAITGLKDMLGQVPKPAELVSMAMNKVMGKFKELVGNLAAPINFVNELGNTLGQFTSKSNPGQFARFTLVMNDAFAALGRGLEPLMSFVMRLGTFVGDMFAKFAPVLSAITGAVARFGDMMIGMYKSFYNDVLTSLKPFIDTLIFYFDEIVPIFMKFNPILLSLRLGFEVLGKAMLLATFPMRKMLQLLQSFGIVGKGKFDPDASSKGMAAQNFSVSTSGDEFQRDLAVKALSSNGPEQKTPDEAMIETPKILKDIYDLIKGVIPGLSKEDKSLTGLSTIENANPMIALANFFRTQVLR